MLLWWKTGVVIKCCWIVCEINQIIHYSYIACHCINVSHVSKSHGPTECVTSCCNCSWHNVAFHEFCNHYLSSTYHMLTNQQLNEITSQRCCIWYYLLQDFFPNDGKLYMAVSAILCPWIYKSSLDHFWDKYAEYKEFYALLNLIKCKHQLYSFILLLYQEMLVFWNVFFYFFMCRICMYAYIFLFIHLCFNRRLIQRCIYDLNVDCLLYVDCLL